MKPSERTCKLLTMHYQTYPQLQIQDLFKFIYQSSFGCEHLLSSPETVTDYIQKEYDSLSHHNQATIEQLDGGYCRVPLSYLDQGLETKTLGTLFYLSARKKATGKEALLQKLSAAKELVCQKRLPFSPEDFEKAAKEWEANGYPAVHHSEVFRQAYHPAYRVIAEEYVPYLPLLAELDRRLKAGKQFETGNVKLAIEGGSASGKTTLSQLLVKLYDCTVFHMDDFFLQPNQRTSERYAQVGGNIDRERFLTEVLIPLSKGEIVNYRKFDCSTLKLLEPIQITPSKLTVIEGVYAMHPELSGYYDLSVYLENSTKSQRKRILRRNSPEMAELFFDKWIPLENIYFENMNVKKRCDIVLSHCCPDS